MTVSSLTKELTMEEMIGWAAFFELQNEEMEKSSSRAQTRQGRTMR